MSYGQFVNALKDNGNTLDALVGLIEGQEGRSKKAKRPSLIELMKQGKA